MKLFRFATAAVIATVAAMGACGGDDAATSGGDAGADATAGDGGIGDAATTDSGATLPPPSSLTFLDFDPSDGGVDGFIHVGHATDDSKITTYGIYYGKSATEKLQNTPITEVPKNVPVESGFPLSLNPIPAGALYLLAYSESDAGVSTPIATRLDRTPAFVDLGDGGMNYAPTVLVDHVSNKLLIGYTGSDGNPHVTRCELDGTACADTTVVTNSNFSVGNISLAIDTTNNSVLAIWPGVFGLAMARCNLDLSGCHDLDISTGKPRNAATYPSVVIDRVDGKILVTASDYTNGERPDLFYCDLAIGVDGGDAVRADGGAACSFVDISAGAPPNTGAVVSNPVLEAVAGKLVVATDDGAHADTTSVFRCNLDGTSCTYTNIDGDAGTDINEFPSLIYDPSDDSVFVTSYDNMAGNARLVHCNATFTTCSPINVAGAVDSSFASSALPTSALDDSNDKIFTIMTNGAQGLSVVRCNRDGSACSAYDMGAGQAARSGLNPAVAADPSSSLFVVTRNQSSSSTKPSLFLLR